MNKSQSKVLRKQLKPLLQPTPIKLTTPATIAALGGLQARNLPFPCYPTLDSEVPSNGPASNNRIKQLWEVSEEALVLEDLSQTPQSPVTTSRPRYDFSYRDLTPEPTPTGAAQYGEYRVPTPPSPSPYTPDPVFSAVPDDDWKMMERDFLGWAPRSMRFQCAEAYDRVMAQRAKREQSVSQNHLSAPCVTKQDHSDAEDKQPC
ncbi:hypothetical protein N0V95_004001 [Ascochyta clinopodiicola]|nr:hypothetical protein N0V95_004001 [Ascochyta clinopodiicola]